MSDRPSLTSPAILLATGFGSGYLPKAPGTWGSALAALIAWPIMEGGGILALAIAAALATLIGIKVTDIYQDRTGESDPGPVVIDEFAGQWLTLLVCPHEPLWWLVGFLAFRLFDILKPWPVRWIDSKMKSATGVMLDDLAAGVYAIILILLAREGAAVFMS